MPRPRKTPDQVLEEKTEKDKAALEAKAKEDAAIAHVAELEKDLGEDVAPAATATKGQVQRQEPQRLLLRLRIPKSGPEMSRLSDLELAQDQEDVQHVESLEDDRPLDHLNEDNRSDCASDPESGGSGDEFLPGRDASGPDSTRDESEPEVAQAVVQRIVWKRKVGRADVEAKKGADAKVNPSSKAVGKRKGEGAGPLGRHAIAASN
ncbi:hypothetical protein BN946_scf184680.g3 [Trametes cinnabarina]|uniref:Uncharacterized protein n=1 Tax=Pycnoporus cinnabarinus TaxID=5643 RepID=A0A060SVG3_PYCCI|nr:hypothetical protein BN946_scf184680.g3 [Trametes cinnabarina]